VFGSEILDVAVGLALVYLLLSLVASAAREGIEGIVKARAIFLERGIRELLDDKSGDKLAKRFYEHPLVFSLFPGRYEAKARRWLGRNMPTYIPARNFASALLDLTLRGPEVGPYAAQRTTPALSISELRASVQRIESTSVQRAILSAIDRAQGDLAQVQANLEAWFDGAMDSVSGWYKRRTQLVLFGIGLVTAIALNVNTMTIATYLWNNEVARQSLARRAEIVAEDTTYRRLVRDTTRSAANIRARYEDLASLSLPIGWATVSKPAEGARAVEVWTFWLSQVMGLLLTTFAIMLGAPFWFDTLNKIIVIRSTVKPHEKSPEEASEDRQKPERSAESRTSSQPPSDSAPAPRTSRRRRGAPTAEGDGADTEPSAPAIETPHTPQEWARGDRDEGIL
jgi:hypothetical protein